LVKNSRAQLHNMAQMPFIHQWIAVMPDMHLGKGATIGSVIPTWGAVIPAAGKDPDVIDETLAAYKPIDKVMAVQTDLVEMVYTLKQALCVKG
jgi:RNA-splicing ligase RtcB